MVKRAEAEDAGSEAYTSPPHQSDMLLRKASAVAMIIFLYTAATPFSPIGWAIGAEGAFLLDRFLAGLLLFAAMYFQWRIAEQTNPVAVYIPTSSGSYISNGVMQNTSREIVWLYRPTRYWKYYATEAALLAVAEFGGMENVRRGVVTFVVAALWPVGWFITPQWLKAEAWRHLKAMWFWMALDEMMNVGYSRRARRFRY